MPTLEEWVWIAGLVVIAYIMFGPLAPDPDRHPYEP